MDYKKAVKDKKEELDNLFKRMDEDRDLVNLSKFVLKDTAKKPKAIPNSISITLNDPAVFCSNIEASLNNSSEQVVVESDDKKMDTSYVEDAIKAAFRSADNRLSKSGRWPLNSFFDQQMCRRGRGAARCLFRMIEGELVADITPWDTRYFYYAIGVDGLLWAAYETTRAKDMILAEYPDAKVQGKEGVVLDIWGKDINEVYVDDVRISDQKNPFGYVPICIQMVPLGSMLADKDSQKYQGESIFFLIRDLLPELNRLVSIIQSLNVKALDNALQYKSKEGITATAPTHDDVTAPGAITPMDIGGGFEPMPYGEIRQSAYLLHQIIESRIQQGSISKFELGAFTQPMSAVALIEIGQGRDQIFLPRLGARGLLKTQLANMLIDQIIKTSESTISLGTRGHKADFQISKLQGEYEIVYKYFIKSPNVDIARFSMAAAAGNLIPDRAKRREILQREDPDEDERLLRWEEAERLSPVVKMFRVVKSLREEAERGDEDAEYEAELLEAEMETTFEQMLSGEKTQILKPGEEQKPQQMLPLLPQEQGAAQRGRQIIPQAEGK